jgi:enoyl-CoA hydratase/carnithine racemase
VVDGRGDCGVMSRIPGTVLEELDERIVILRLSRPGRLNATGEDMQAALRDALDRWATDDRCQAVVLTGDGQGAFSSGADLGDERTHSTPVDPYLEKLAVGEHPVFDRVLRFPKPLVAAVSGYAIGWGCLICLGCDLIVADRTAEFRLTQATFGVLPAYAGVARLAQWVGRGRAMEIAVRRRPVRAEEAHEMGLVAEICEEGELLEVAKAVAQQCAEVPPLTYKLIKDSMYQAMEGAIRATATGDLYRLGLLEQAQTTRAAHQAWRDRKATRDSVQAGKENR